MNIAFGIKLTPFWIVWIDDLRVTFWAEHPGVCVMLPFAGPSAVEATTWGGIKALFK